MAKNQVKGKNVARLSAQGKARIQAAARKRWAAYRKAKKANGSANGADEFRTRGATKDLENMVRKAIAKGVEQVLRNVIG